MSNLADGLPSIFLDESGNTGPDLLNEVQPLFVLASVRLGASDAAELVAPLVDDQGEAKFSTIRHDPTARAALMEFLRSGHLGPETARVSLFHKPYMTVAKLVDLLMEPGFHRRGLDEEWRTDGSTLKWPNTLYEHAGDTLGDTWIRLLRAFILGVRRPSPAKTALVVRLLDEGLAKEPDARIEFPLSVMREEVEEYFGSLYDRKGRPHPVKVDPLDPAVPGLVEHIDHWGKALGPFVVIHDASTALERSLPHINVLCDPGMKPYEVHGPGGTARFPLQGRQIRFADSKIIPQIQVADLVAGACALQQGSFETPSSDAQLAREVAATGIARVFGQFVAPTEFIRRSMKGVS